MIITLENGKTVVLDDVVKDPKAESLEWLREYKKRKAEINRWLRQYEGLWQHKESSE